MSHSNFETLCRTNERRLRSFIHRLGIPPSDLDDFQQEVWCTALMRHHTYDPERPFALWLMGIAAKRAKDFRSLARFRYEQLGEAPEQRDHQIDLDQSVITRESKELLQNALAEMGPRYRATVELYELRGRTMHHISRALDVPLATAYTYLRKGRHDLARSLRQAALVRNEPSPQRARRGERISRRGA